MSVRLNLMACLLAIAGPALAEPPPFKDFTFKRVKAPRPGVTPRITVQISPPEAPSAAVTAAATAPRMSPGGTLDWFWSALPAPAPGTGALRLEAGLRALDKGDLDAPPLADLSAIAADHGTEILTATIGTGVSPALALAVIAVESGGREDAVSRTGASGLMQLMPATAERFGVADPGVAADNIRGGVAYLDWLLREFGGDPILALAGYNAGENAVRAAGDVPDYPETRGYVPKVLAAWRVARGLCRTPPELVSDGCVFVSG